MTDRCILTLIDQEAGKKAMAAAWAYALPHLQQGQRMVVEVRKEKRTDAQNALLWASLTDIANQVEWYGQKLTPEDYKHMLTASLKKQRVVPGVDGNFVVLGLSTSKMTKSELSGLQELVFAFGAERGVKFKPYGDE